MSAFIAAATALSTGGSIYGADSSKSASEQASRLQSQSAQAGINEQRYQFDKLQQALQPYQQAGADALSQQRAMLGLGGPLAQQDSISALMASPQFSSMVQQGENALLQSASATGGLRGGNTQSALAQFRPAILNQLLEQQYSRLGGLTSIGQNAAAGVGNAGMTTGANIGNLLAQQGAAQAGGALAGGAYGNNIASAISGGLGTYVGLGGTFGKPANGGLGGGYTSQINQIDAATSGGGFGSNGYNFDLSGLGL